MIQGKEKKQMKIIKEGKIKKKQVKNEKEHNKKGEKRK